MNTYALIGKNIEYSFSRQYFTEKFKREGIADCQYINFDIQSLDEYGDRAEQNSRVIDETLALFKGELSYEDIMYNIPKKRLFELRDVRIKRLSEEQKALDRQQKDAQNQMVRDSILKK